MTYPLVIAVATVFCGALWWVATFAYASSQDVAPESVVVGMMLGGGALTAAGALAELRGGRFGPAIEPSPCAAPHDYVDPVVADTVDDVVSALTAARVGDDRSRAAGEARRVLDRMRQRVAER
ncbi:hypothetical protein [Rhodococcus wratislaviensis]|uniref:hypothetical protein n=1 Tax=Rhodococcus wratislaviensis TaxID=44752 RepID=UPI000F56287C|nr:hypothetical protein [Rhodococcus wratislaviensis]